MGDNAETAMIELVDFNEIYGKGKGEAKETGKKTRRAGGRKKTTEKTETGEPAKTARATPVQPKKNPPKKKNPQNKYAFLIEKHEALNHQRAF